MQFGSITFVFCISLLSLQICTAQRPLSSSEILEACLATRESELGRFQAVFQYQGQFLSDKSMLSRLLLAEEFLAVTKRDGQNVFYSGTQSSGPPCVYTVKEGSAFHFAPVHDVSKRMKSTTVRNGDLTCVRFVDPIGLGFFETNYEPLDISRATKALASGHDEGTVSVTEGESQGNATWIISAKTQETVVTLVFDQMNFRLLKREVTLLGQPRRFVSESEYTDRFPVRSIPTLVRFREYLNDEIVFESTREMTAFDPNPIFTENDFGLAALGLPPGSDYLDETTERFVKWNGSEAISPDFANHPLVDRDLIARKAAEEAKNNGWNKQYPMYAIAGIGILAALLLIYRQRQKKA